MNTRSKPLPAPECAPGSPQKRRGYTRHGLHKLKAAVNRLDRRTSASKQLDTWRDELLK